MVVSEGVVVGLKGGVGGPKYCRLPPGSALPAASGSPWHEPPPADVPPIEQLLWMMGMRSFWSETVEVEGFAQAEAPPPDDAPEPPLLPQATPTAREAKVAKKRIFEVTRCMKTVLSP